MNINLEYNAQQQPFSTQKRLQNFVYNLKTASWLIYPDFLSQDTWLRNLYPNLNHLLHKSNLDEDNSAISIFADLTYAQFIKEQAQSHYDFFFIKDKKICHSYTSFFLLLQQQQLILLKLQEEFLTLDVNQLDLEQKLHNSKQKARNKESNNIEIEEANSSLHENNYSSNPSSNSASFSLSKANKQNELLEDCAQIGANYYILQILNLEQAYASLDILALSLGNKKLLQNIQQLLNKHLEQTTTSQWLLSCKSLLKFTLHLAMPEHLYQTILEQSNKAITNPAELDLYSLFSSLALTKYKLAHLLDLNKGIQQVLKLKRLFKAENLNFIEQTLVNKNNQGYLLTLNAQSNYLKLQRKLQQVVATQLTPYQTANFNISLFNKAALEQVIHIYAQYSTQYASSLNNGSQELLITAEQIQSHTQEQINSLPYHLNLEEQQKLQNICKQASLWVYPEVYNLAQIFKLQQELSYLTNLEVQLAHYTFHPLLAIPQRLLVNQKSFVINLVAKRYLIQSYASYVYLSLTNPKLSYTPKLKSLSKEFIKLLFNLNYINHTQALYFYPSFKIAEIEEKLSKDLYEFTKEQLKELLVASQNPSLKINLFHTAPNLQQQEQILYHKLKICKNIEYKETLVTKANFFTSLFADYDYYVWEEVKIYSLSYWDSFINSLLNKLPQALKLAHVLQQQKQLTIPKPVVNGSPDETSLPAELFCPAQELLKRLALQNPDYNEQALPLVNNKLNLISEASLRQSSPLTTNLKLISLAPNTTKQLQSYLALALQKQARCYFLVQNNFKYWAELSSQLNYLQEQQGLKVTYATQINPQFFKKLSSYLYQVLKISMLAPSKQTNLSNNLQPENNITEQDPNNTSSAYTDDELTNDLAHHLKAEELKSTLFCTLNSATAFTALYRFFLQFLKQINSNLTTLSILDFYNTWQTNLSKSELKELFTSPEQDTVFQQIQTLSKELEKLTKTEREQFFSLELTPYSYLDIAYKLKQDYCNLELVYWQLNVQKQGQKLLLVTVVLTDLDFSAAEWQQITFLNQNLKELKQQALQVIATQQNNYSLIKGKLGDNNKFQNLSYWDEFVHNYQLRFILDLNYLEQSSKQRQLHTTTTQDHFLQEQINLYSKNYNLNKENASANKIRDKQGKLLVPQHLVLTNLNERNYINKLHNLKIFLEQSLIGDYRLHRYQYQQGLFYSLDTQVKIYPLDFNQVLDYEQALYITYSYLFANIAYIARLGFHNKHYFAALDIAYLDPILVYSNFILHNKHLAKFIPHDELEILKINFQFGFASEPKAYSLQYKSVRDHNNQHLQECNLFLTFCNEYFLYVFADKSYRRKKINLNMLINFVSTPLLQKYKQEHDIYSLNPVEKKSLAVLQEKLNQSLSIKEEERILVITPAELKPTLWSILKGYLKVILSKLKACLK